MGYDMRLCRCTSARHTSTALNHKPKKEKKKTQQNRYYMRMRNACTKCAQPITNYYVEKENIIMQYTMKINITLFCSLGPATRARARSVSLHYISIYYVSVHDFLRWWPVWFCKALLYSVCVHNTVYLLASKMFDTLLNDFSIIVNINLWFCSTERADATRRSRIEDFHSRLYAAACSVQQQQKHKTFFCFFLL